MTMSLQTVTVHVPAPQLPTLCTRLTTYLLHKHYAFLQTCHGAAHTDFDVFQQQHALVRVTLQAIDVQASLPMLASELPSTLAAEAVAIIHHLLAVGTPIAGPIT
jgi:hypothetical protein